MDRLRDDPDTGCPRISARIFAAWCRQPWKNATKLAQAIENEDFPHVAEELGDVLFQVVFYARLAASGPVVICNHCRHPGCQTGRRHPHVFGGGEIEGVVTDSVSVESVKASWEAIKREERSAKSQGHPADVPLALPALPRAQKLQKRASGVNFDWPDAAAVLANWKRKSRKCARPQRLAANLK